ncbi:hypothetical protein E2C01_083994 [Portunus trituberculatus]|uniref:Uncharacterized protein n=1 Tax=Portunus trituberculatus TaxID=210409 RepID=A0A5B7J548_PORTR|nr:hypothetical protein [Portunus trituberculatus]
MSQGSRRRTRKDARYLHLPKTNGEGERFKVSAQKNHDSGNDPRLSARNATIIPRRSPYFKG